MSRICSVTESREKETKNLINDGSCWPLIEGGPHETYALQAPTTYTEAQHRQALKIYSANHGR